MTSDEAREKGEGQISSKKFVELVVGADPCPGNRVATAFTDRTVLCADADRPDPLVPTELLELERGMIRILLKKAMRFARGFAGSIIEPFVSPPEARARE